MILASTILVPELQYWFDQAINHSILNKARIPNPVSIPSLYLPQNSFIKLLFDDSWEPHFTHYRYLYRRNEDKSCWPGIVRNRMCVYPRSKDYYVCDFDPPDCNVNLFNLQNDDIMMLDILLEYRLHPSTTSLVVDFYSLTTRLSKLIYLYLDLVINKKTDKYNDDSLISSDDTLLESTYEAYLVDCMFRFVSAKPAIVKDDIFDPFIP